MTSQTWQLSGGKARLREKGAKFPLQLMSLWVSGRGRACRRGEAEEGWAQAKQSKSTESLDLACQLNTDIGDGTQTSYKRHQETTTCDTVHACQDRRKWRIMGDTWGREPQRHRMTVDRWTSCLSDRRYTCQPSFRWAVDFQLKLIVFAS